MSGWPTSPTPPVWPNQSQNEIVIVQPITNAQPSNPWDKLDQDALLVLWDIKKKTVETAKNEEMELRKYIVARAFPNKQEGINTVELGAGYELKATIKFNYNLADNDTVEKTLEKIAAIGNQGAFIADRLINWKPSFLLTEYRKLQSAAESGSQDAQAILATIGEMLTVDDAAPTLAIKEPKKKK